MSYSKLPLHLHLSGFITSWYQKFQIAALLYLHMYHQAAQVWICACTQCQLLIYIAAGFNVGREIEKMFDWLPVSTCCAQIQLPRDVLCILTEMLAPVRTQPPTPPHVHKHRVWFRHERDKQYSSKKYSLINLCLCMSGQISVWDIHKHMLCIV